VLAVQSIVTKNTPVRTWFIVAAAAVAVIAACATPRNTDVDAAGNKRDATADADGRVNQPVDTNGGKSDAQAPEVDAPIDQTTGPIDAGAEPADAAVEAPLTCSPSEHVCEGKCVPNNAPATCGSSCQPCPSIKNGTATCDGTQCGGTCPSGNKLCLGECIPNARSCTGVCASGSHDCQGVCAEDSSVNSCGTACAPCPTPAGSRATCDGKKCDFTCQTGKRCTPTSNECVTGCCTDSECTPPANKVGRCDLTTHACVFTCATGFKACGNACIPNAGCCDDCAGNRACVANVCSTTACKTGFKSCNGACVPNATCCPTAETCFNGVDDDCDNATDCADSDCTAGAMCVPAVTDGFAIGVRVGLNDSCPVGYTASPKNVHRNLSAGTACTGCTCTHIPTVCKAVAVAYGPTASDFCNGVLLGELQSRGGNCSGFTSATLDVSRLSVTGYQPVTTCQAPAGSTGQRSPATWAQSYKFCERVAGPTGGGCASGLLCVAKSTATVCALAAGARACPNTYSSSANWYGGFSDTRVCTNCQCQMGVGSCPTSPDTQSADLFRSPDCSGSPFFYVYGESGGNCSQGSALTKTASVKYLGTPVQASCSSQPSTVGSGAATPNDPQSFCCLP
jgi:hypothetical protein